MSAQLGMVANDLYSLYCVQHIYSVLFLLLVGNFRVR